MAIVVFALAVIICETIANQIKCKKFDLENVGQD